MRSESSSSTESRAPSESRVRNSGDSSSRCSAWPNASGEPGGTSNPLTPSDDDLADPAYGRRDHRRADRERLDCRVREVLPVAGEDRSLRTGERFQHLLAREGADEADASVQTGVVRMLLETGAVGAVADDRQTRWSARTRVRRERRASPSAGSGGRRRRGRSAQSPSPPAPAAQGSGRRAGARSRVPSRARSRRGIGSGRSTSARARARASAPRFSAVSRVPPACWKSSSDPSKRPQRRARSYAGSETSLTTRGRRAADTCGRGRGVRGRRVDDVRLPRRAGRRGASARHTEAGKDALDRPSSPDTAAPSAAPTPSSPPAPSGPGRSETGPARARASPGRRRQGARFREGQ